VKSVVYLTTRTPSKLTDELALAGYRIFEALSVSEVLYLCEQHDIDAVVIATEVDDPDLIEAQMRRITIKLKPEATVRELIWELSQLFPDKAETVQ
jgi:AmiR/NasT family two-component response regulator